MTMRRKATTLRVTLSGTWSCVGYSHTGPNPAMAATALGLANISSATGGLRRFRNKVWYGLGQHGRGAATEPRRSTGRELFGGPAEGQRREGEANASRNRRNRLLEKARPCIPEGYGGLKTLRVTAVSMGSGARLEQGEFRNRQGLPGTGTYDDCLWLSSSSTCFR